MDDKDGRPRFILTGKPFVAGTRFEFLRSIRIKFSSYVPMRIETRTLLKAMVVSR
jgi:hypothetical protein